MLQNERVLFHYNGHGVPRPTVNGEIWVFNKSYTQYIPMSIYDLQAWLGTPCIFVFDCSAAGLIVNSFKAFAEQKPQVGAGCIANCVFALYCTREACFCFCSVLLPGLLKETIGPSSKMHDITACQSLGIIFPFNKQGTRHKGMPDPNVVHMHCATSASGDKSVDCHMSLHARALLSFC